MQVLEALDLGCVRTVTVRPGGLQDGGEALDAGVREEGAEAFAHLATADVRVPVAVRPQLGGRVVDVEATEPVEADPLVDLAEGRVVGLRIGDVDARDPEMTGVEAEPQARMADEPVDQCRELVDRAADRPAGAG